MFDGLASAGPFDNIAYLVAPVRRDDDVDVPAQRFGRREAEQAFGGSVPAGNGAVQQLGDDGIVRRFHDGAEEAIAFGSKVPFRGGLQTQRAEQAGQLRLQADIVDKQYGEHVTSDAEAGYSPEIEADFEPLSVQYCRQHD